MGLKKANTKSFHRKLYAGIAQTIQLMKRGDDQREGQTTQYPLYACWREPIHKSGNPLQKDMSVNHSTIWYIPSEQLKRNGINYLNVLDTIISVEDNITMYWRPEEDQTISLRLFSNYYVLQVVRCDPPSIS